MFGQKRRKISLRGVVHPAGGIGPEDLGSGRCGTPFIVRNQPGQYLMMLDPASRGRVCFRVGRQSPGPGVAEKSGGGVRFLMMEQC